MKVSNVGIEGVKCLRHFLIVRNNFVVNLEVIYLRVRAFAACEFVEHVPGGSSVVLNFLEFVVVVVAFDFSSELIVGLPEFSEEFQVCFSIVVSICFSILF